MRLLPHRKPGRDAEVFAEAAALMDDGLDADFVLGLYPDESDWLAPLLRTTAGVGKASESDQPSYFFEASLKSKFLAAARDGRPARALPQAVGYQPQSPLRTAVSSAGIMVAAGVLGIATLGFVTSEEAVPGDWNYSFKRAQERVEYALARGDGKVDVQINHAEARVNELRKQGDGAGQGDIERLTSVLAELEELARKKDLDEYQKSEIGNLTRNVSAVLATVTERQAPPAVLREAKETTDNLATAAGVGGATGLPAATASPSPAADETPTAAAAETPTATATASETPVEETPTPEETETPEPATATPEPTGTATEPIVSETPGAAE